MRIARWACAGLAGAAIAIAALAPTIALAGGEGAPPPPTPPATAREIYVPRADWDQVIAREGRGIFVRYRELLELYRRGEGRPPSEEAPPALAVIESAAYEGALVDDAAVLEATYRIRTLAEAVSGPAIPVALELGGVGGAEATLDGAPAELRLDGGRVSALVRGPAGAHALVVRMSVPALRKGALREVAFDVAPAASARLDLEVPDALEATSEPPLLTRERLADGEARLSIACGGARRISLTLRPRDDGKPAAPYAVVEEAAYATVGEGSVRVDATLRFDVHRAPLPTLALELPEGMTLLDVQAPDLVRFAVTGRRLEIERARPNEGRFEVSVSLGRAVDPGAPVALRPIGVPGAARVAGIVVVDPAPGIAARVALADGLLELPAARAAEAPRPPAAALAGQRAPAPASPSRIRVFAHERAAFRLDVRPEPLPARAVATVAMVVSLEDREAVLHATLATSVAEGSLFRLTIGLPPDLEVTDIGVDRPGGTWDRRFVDEGGTRRLEIDLRRPAARGDDVRVSLVGRAPYPGGATLRGVTSAALPVLRPAGFERAEGVLAVVVDPAYRLSAERTSGLEPLDAALVPAELARFGAPALAFRVVSPEVAAATSLRRDAPRVDATVVSYIAVATGRISVRQEIALEVTRAPIDSVTLLVPPGTGARVHVDGEAVKEQAVEPAGALGDRIRVRLQGEIQGVVRLFADAEGRVEEWTPTGSAEALAPLVRVEGVARDEGSVVVLAGDATEIAPRPRDLEAIDAAELPPMTRPAPDGRLVFAWRSALPSRGLSLGLTRREDEPLLTAAVASADVATAVDPEGRARTRARFDVRNARNQSIGIRLPAGALLLSILLDGEGAKPAKSAGAGAGELFLVPLDEAHLGREALGLEVVYETRHEPWIDQGGDAGSGRFEDLAPAVVVGGVAVPVLASSLELRLPRGFRYTAFGGTAERLASGLDGPTFYTWLARRPSRVGTIALLAAAIALGLALAAALASWARARLTARRLVIGALVGLLLGGCVLSSLYVLQTGGDRRYPSTGVMEGFATLNERMKAGHKGAIDMPVGAPAPDDSAALTVATATRESAHEELADEDRKAAPARRLAEATPAPASPAPAGTAPEKPKSGGDGTDLAMGGKEYAAAHEGALPSGVEAGLRSLAINLPATSRHERFRLPVVGEGRVTVDFAGASTLEGRAAIWGLLGLVIGFLAARERRGAECRFFVLALTATTLGGLILGPSWSVAADGLFAGLLGAALVRAAGHLAGRIGRIALGRAPDGGARDGSGNGDGSHGNGSGYGGGALLAAAVAGLLAASASTALADEPAARDARGAALAPPPGTRVYVPYDPEHPARVGLDGEVFVPLSDFERLWERARAAEATQPAPATSDEAFIVASRFTGKVSAATAEIEAVFLVKRPAHATVPVALDLAGAAIESARLGGAPAVLEAGPRGVVVLVGPVEEATKLRRLEIAELTVRLRVPVIERRASVAIAPAPVARARLDLDAPGYELLIPTARGAVQSTGGAAPRVEADLGGAAALSLVLSAEPARGAAPGAPLEAKAESETTVRLRATHSEISVDATVRASGGRIDVVRFTLPPGVEPTAVQGPAIRSWKIVGEDAARLLEAHAYEPAESLTVRVFADLPIPAAGRAAFAGLPVRDVAQERGTIAVVSRASERPTIAKRTGLVQIDAAQVAASRELLAGEAVLAAFRFSARPAEVEVERVAQGGKVTASTELRVRLEDRRAVAEVVVRWKPEGRPLFEAAIVLPPGALLDGLAAPGAIDTLEAAAAPGAGRALRLRFPEGRTEPFETRVLVSRPRAQDEAALALPVFELPGVERVEGVVLVATSSDVEVGVLEASGLDVIDPARIEAGPVLAGAVPRLAWRHGASGAPAARLSLKPVAPEVAATVLVATTLHPDLVESDARIVLDVRRSGVLRLTVELPAWVGDGASFAAEGLREVSSAEAPSARFPDGRARVYLLSFQRPVLGRRAIDLFFERPQALAGAGAAQGAVELPCVFVREAASGRAYLLAQTDGRTSARLEEASVAGAERAARDDLPLAILGDLPGGGDFVFAYLVRGVPRVAVRRLALEARERIEAIVDTADILTALDPTGLERTRARYAIQNRSEQFLELRLPAGATLWSCFVADEPAKPVRRPDPAGDRTLVPLPKRGKGELSFEVEVVYERQGEPLSSWSQAKPAAPAVLNMRVSETFWTLRVPEATRVFSVDGNVEETLEAVKERRRLEKAVEELNTLADLMRTGNDAEKRNAFTNWSAQVDRVDEQRRRAEASQSVALRYAATADQANKTVSDLNANETAITELNRRQIALQNDVQAVQQLGQQQLAQNLYENRRGKRAFDERLAKKQQQEVAETARIQAEEVAKAEEEKKAAEAAAAASTGERRASTLDAYRRAVEQVQSDDDGKKVALTLSGTLGRSSYGSRSPASIDNTTPSQTASPTSYFGLGETNVDFAAGTPLDAFSDGTRRRFGGTDVGGTAPANNPSGGGGAGRGWRLAQNGTFDPNGAAAGQKGGASGASPRDGREGERGRDGASGGERGGVDASKTGKAFEGGRLSLRLPIPETGRALHFRKSGGDPEIRLRAARFELPGAETALRLLALVLLLLVARASGVARGGEGGSPLLGTLGVIALGALGLLATQGVGAAAFSCSLLGIAWIVLRRRAA